MKNLIKPFAVILSSAILFAQVKTTVKASKIVYVGLKVEDVEPWVKDELEKKMNIIFNDLEQEKLIMPIKANELADAFNKNFAQFADNANKEILAAAPKSTLRS